MVADGSYAEHGHIGAVGESAAGAHLNLFERTLPVDQFAAAARVAYHEGALVGQLRRIHEPAQLVLVHGRCDGEVGNGAQEGHVEGAVVGGAVLAHQSGAVQTDYHGQPQQGGVVYDIVVGPLRESAVDVAEGLQTVGGHAGREGHGVALGDAHIEGACGQGLHHDVHGAAGGHGGSNPYDAAILAGQLKEGMAEHVLVFGRDARLLAVYALAGLHVELAGCMPHGGGFLGGLVALALDGVQVEQLGALHVFQLAQQAHYLLHVVAVEGSEVAYVHALEHILLMADGRLDGVVEAYQTMAAVVAEHAAAVEPLRELVAQVVVGLVGVEVEQILLHAAHGVVDAHVVVVENDEHVVVARRHIVQSLIGQTAAHGAVAYHGHHMLCLVFAQLGGHRHAEGCRDGVGGMAAGEGVVFALPGRGEGHESVQFSVGAEPVAPAG